MVDILASEGLAPAEQMPPSAELGNSKINTADAVAPSLGLTPVSLTQLSAPGHADVPPPVADPEAAMNAQSQQPNVPSQAPNGQSGTPTMAPDAAAPPQSDDQSVSSQNTGDLEAGNAMGLKDGTAATQPVDGAARDIFNEEKISPPTIDQANSNAFSSGLDLSNPQTAAQQQAINYVKSVQDQTQQVSQMRYSPAEQDAIKAKGPIGFMEAVGNIKNDIQVEDIINKQQLGVDLTPADQQTLNAYIDRKLEENIRGYSWGGQVAQLGKPFPSSILNLVTNGNLQAAIKASPVSSTNSTAPSVPIGDGTLPAPYTPGYGETALNDASAVTDKGKKIYDEAQDKPASAALKSFGYIASAAAQGAEEAMDLNRPLGMDYETNEFLVKAGIFNSLDKDAPQNPIKFLNESVIRSGAAGLDAAARVISTLFSAGVGAAREAAIQAGQPELASTIEDLPNALMGEEGTGSHAFHVPEVSPIISSAVSKLPVDVQSRIYDAYKNVYPNASLSTTLSASGWPNAVDKIGEEQLSSILNETNNSDNNGFDDYMKNLVSSPDIHSVESGLVSINGGTHTATDLGMNILGARGVSQPEAMETMQNLTAIERENFVNKNLPMPTSSYPQLEPGFDNAAEGMPEAKMADLERKHDALPPEDPQRVQIQQQMDDLANRAVSQYEPVYADDLGTAAIPEQQMRFQQEANPAPIQDNQSSFNDFWKNAVVPHWKAFYASFENDIQPVEDLGNLAEKVNPDLAGANAKQAGLNSKFQVNFARNTAVWIERTLTTDTTRWNEAGEVVKTGKGLKQIYDDFDNAVMDKEPSLKQRQADFSDYQIARSLLEDQDAGRLKITDNQQEKYIDNLPHLYEKYGDKFLWLEALAKENTDYRNRVLHNLVDQGVWSEEKYQQVISSRSSYAPLSRMIEDEDWSGVSKRLGQSVNPNSIGSLKSRGEGSDLEIRPTYLSDVENTAKILQKSAMNKVRLNMAKYADIYPEKVHVSGRKVTPPVMNSYDPKFRAKLEAMVNDLGGSIERSKYVAGKGLREGDFNPMESLIRLRLGSTEGTLAHEAGHLLDEKLGLQKELLNDPIMRAQLENLSDDRLNTEISLEKNPNDPEGAQQFNETRAQNSEKYENYVKSDPELIANFFDAYLNKPKSVDEIAPDAKAKFEEILDKNPNLQYIRDIEPSTARAQEIIRPPQHVPFGPKDSIPFYDNGKLKDMVLSKDLLKVFQDTTPVQHDLISRMLLGTLKGTANILRAGAVDLNPAFIARHLVRSIETGWVRSGASPLDFGRGVISLLSKNGLYTDWATVTGAGKGSHIDLTDKGLQKMWDGLGKSPSLVDRLNPLNWLKGIKDISDQATKIGTYGKLLDKGYSPIEAGLLSLDSGNWGRGGSVVKKISPYIPFIKDAIEGPDQSIRSLKRDPVGYMMRGLAFMTLPQMLLTGYYLYGADAQTRQEYKDLPAWRMMFMNVKIGNLWVPFPKPFQEGLLFQTLPEMIMRKMAGTPDGENFYKNLLMQMGHSLSPVFDWTKFFPPVFKAAIENTTHYNLFQQHQIYPSAWTSETGKLVASELSQAWPKIFNYSPEMVDQTVQDMAGNTGKYVMQFSDMAINKIRQLQGQPVAEKPMTPEHVPFLGGMLEDTAKGYDTSEAELFFDNLSKVENIQKTEKNLQTENKQDFDRQNANDLAEYKPMEKARHDMTAQNKQIKQIIDDPNMSSDDKIKAIQIHQDAITQIAKQANINYSNAKGQR